MRELLNVLDAVQTLAGSGESFALATVVATSGSTYRSPGAHQLVTESSSVGTVCGGCLDSQVLLMNHNFLRDGDALVSLIGTDVAAYLGLLGPAERATQLLKYAAEQGAPASEADLAKIHGPAGLDIGADGPLEIAWSVTAEMLAVDRGRAGGSLRDR